MSHVDDVTVTAIESVLPIPRARNGYPYRVRTPESLHILDANSVPIRVKYVYPLGIGIMKDCRASVSDGRKIMVVHGL
jgi:hypothetical protein